MAKINVDVNVIGIDKIRTLVEVLSNDIDSLSEELRQTVLACLDCDVFEYDNDAILAMGYEPHEVDIYCNGKKPTRGVVSANPHLKRLTVYPSQFYNGGLPSIVNEEFELGFYYPESFSIKDSGGNVLVQW